MISLRSDEHPEHIWHALTSELLPPGRRNLQRSIYLLLLLTDQRLILLERGGLFHRHLEPFDEIELETVKGTTIREGFVGNAITISAEAVSGMKKVWLRDLMEADQVTMRKRDYADVVGFEALMGRSVQRRQRQMNGRMRSETGQGSIDFTTLRERMARGGLVVQAVKCPICGTSLELPTSGHEMRCHHCQATIQAEDLLARIKENVGA